MSKRAVLDTFMISIGVGLSANAAKNPHDHRGQATERRCLPNANQVTVFQHPNYKGRCSVLNAREYLTSRDMNMKDNSISSIMVGRNMQIEVCDLANATRTRRRMMEAGTTGRPNYGGCQVIRKSRPRLARVVDKINISDNRISSAKVERRAFDRPRRDGACNPGTNRDAVALYEHPFLKGKCRILGIGSYVNAKQMNFKNDRVSSIEFPRNAQVYIEVCQHAKFGGMCETLRTTDLSGRVSLDPTPLTSKQRAAEVPGGMRPPGTVFVSRPISPDNVLKCILGVR
jgi:hypothetical protein